MAAQTSILGASWMLSDGQELVTLAFEVIAYWGTGGVMPQVSKAYLPGKLKGNFQGAPACLGCWQGGGQGCQQCRFGGSSILDLAIACSLLALEY
jgi:hypothetical protein